MPSPDEIMSVLVDEFFHSNREHPAMIFRRRTLVNALHLAAIQYRAIADSTPDTRLSAQFAKQAEEISRLADEVQVAYAIRLED